MVLLKNANSNLLPSHKPATSTIERKERRVFEFAETCIYFLEKNSTHK